MEAFHQNTFLTTVCISLFFFSYQIQLDKQTSFLDLLQTEQNYFRKMFLLISTLKWTGENPWDLYFGLISAFHFFWIFGIFWQVVPPCCNKISLLIQVTMYLETCMSNWAIIRAGACHTGEDEDISILVYITS